MKQIEFFTKGQKDYDRKFYKLNKENNLHINTINKLQNQINEYEIMKAMMETLKTHVHTQESNYQEAQEKLEKIIAKQHKSKVEQVINQFQQKD